MMMESVSLTDLVNDLLAEARGRSNGRSSQTVHGGHEHALRQTVIALAEGQGLNEHEGPPEATLQVLVGRVRLSSQSDSWEGVADDFLVIPRERHDLVALADSAVLLTVSVSTTAQT